MREEYSEMRLLEWAEIQEKIYKRLSNADGSSDEQGTT